MARDPAGGDEDANLVIDFVALLTIDLVYGVGSGHPPSANTPSTIFPVAIHILTKREARSSSLLGSSDGWPAGKDTVQACQVQAERNVWIRRHRKLDLEQFAHVVADLRDIFRQLVLRVRGIG